MLLLPRLIFITKATNFNMSDVQTEQILLLGPGPSNSYPGVLEAIAQPTLGHLDPDFILLMDEIQKLLQYAWQTKSQHTYVVSGPGSLGMETCFVNLVEPGDKIIVCHNGFFGNRMLENAKRFGAEVVSISGVWGEPINPQVVADTLAEHPDAKLLSVVHAETSTGVRNDVETICKLAKAAGCLSIVDAVTALGAIPLKVQEWGIDAIYSCSQKGLGSVPGMSPVTFSEAAFEKVRNRTTPVPSWFQDITVYDSYWNAEKRPYHHTAPAHHFYALLAALRFIHAKGLDVIWQEQQAVHEYFAEQMESRGWRFFVAREHRLPQLNTMLLPDGLNDVDGRTALRRTHKIEVGAGLGEMAGKLWRIGIMGANVQKAAVDRLLEAIDTL
jgi:alanine-glyoxylate transaminase / serine-glyoxylate transaminase / serine-pyruvate transaminase